jgi:hypothetical protein
MLASYKIGLPQIELRVIFDTKLKDAYFWDGRKKHKALHLYGGEDEYYVLDHPLPEALVGWVDIEIIDIDQNAGKFEIKYHGHGLDPKMIEFIDELRAQLVAIVENGVSSTIDLTHKMNSTGWVIQSP